jgi:hypothetical protein
LLASPSNWLARVSRFSWIQATRPVTYAQQVLGLSLYTDMYFEAGGYRPLSSQTQLALGISPTGQSPLSGVAPYWRVAAEKNIGNHSIEFGSFGLSGQVFPMGLSQAGTDSFTDIGIDTQYQFLGDPHMGS